jgi:RHH-type proline utilization regulon transcriptional repressor/proline dehydrogenase/delta 1-pyrroline-5-carboxylate dehydrogenase
MMRSPLSRDAIAAAYCADETALNGELMSLARVSPEHANAIALDARRLAEAARAGRHRFGHVDALMHEYGLSSEEGVLLMCLAEALLRIPDKDTADALIADKVAGGQWRQHLGHADDLLVNASTWGLLLTGRIVGHGASDGGSEGALGRLRQWAQRSGESVIRGAMRQAMRILGTQFVIGHNMDEALAVARPIDRPMPRYSFDLLGEAVLTQADADSNFVNHINAIEKLAAVSASLPGDAGLLQRPALSVKLSSLHPRFEPSQRQRVIDELLPRLMKLAVLAGKGRVGLTLDAEEMERLDLTLDLFERVLHADAMRELDGFGLAVQAYSRRALKVLQWLLAQAEAINRPIPVRLVKGAYWDHEIKLAEARGLASYPVFTRKAATDVSYIAAARFLLAHRDRFLLQFATHNAHTIAALTTLAGEPRGLEFQRLHGMGEAIYAELTKDGRWPVRVYAPVGTHKDLLAYLARRLLENGANSSFVNRLADDQAPISELIADPVMRLKAIGGGPHPRIPAPPDLFHPERRNSRGLLLAEDSVRRPLLAAFEICERKSIDVAPLVGGRQLPGEPAPDNRSPQDSEKVIGTVRHARPADIDEALELSQAAQPAWDALGGAARAERLEAAADLYEADRAQLMAVMVCEAGKTLDNALADVREAVDLLRFYAARARAEFAAPLALPAITGERNRYSLHGRGTIACISPWNFPLAIFTGQVAAALAAGNAVAAKPAEQTPATAFLAVGLMHEAGIPEQVVHLLPGDGSVGARLVSDPRINGVAFTGSVETAASIRRALAARPGPIVPFVAETGGINAMIADSSALPEQVVRDVVRSAFDSAGQRCSALRILYVQDDIYDRLVGMLAGAVRQLSIGDPSDYATDIGPVIDAEARDALEAHKARMRQKAKTIVELELPAGCDRGTFVAPAVYEIGGIEELQREVFGPILHVARFGADQLERVCDGINAAGYGLTCGIHSRIEQRIDFIVRRLRVGNIYVNRNQIGAVVGMQPFGGEGLSGTGPKAGGPYSLHPFAVERVISVDTTASGGDATLITISGRDGEEGGAA